MALIRVARSRWHIATGLTLAAVLGLAAWKAPADDGKKTKSDAEESQAERADVMRDVTDKVEVTVNGGLTSTNKTTHSAAVAIKNTSDEDLSGPLVVVVDETGIATLSVKDADGMLELEGDKPYVDVLDKRGTLKAGKSLRTQKIEFETDEALTLDQRKQFSLKLRVLYLPESARTAKRDKNSKGEDLIEGKKYSEQDFARVATIQEKWTYPLLQRGERLVYGTAVAEDKDGNLVVEVYTQRDSVSDMLPKEVDGIPVQNFVIGSTFRAGPARPGALIYPNGVPTKPGQQNAGGKGAPVPDNGPAPGSTKPAAIGLPPISDPTLRFPRPVPIGVSIANADRLFIFVTDPDDVLCYSGTLGCRCIDPFGTEYILTNAHVGAALFIDDAGNIDLDDPDFLIGLPGERIVQTSTGDHVPACVFDGRDIVGVLSDFEFLFLEDFDDIADGTFPPQWMDAAVVRAVPNTVGYATPVDGYGAPRQELATPRIGLPVQKYGRTTIYTDGQITSLNAFVIVLYGNTDGFAGFTKQIMVANTTAFGAPFGIAGDSGALIVVNQPGHPDHRKPVALNFAGGPSGAVDISIGNPLGHILARFNITIDDGSGRPINSSSGTMGGVIGPVDPPSDYFR